MMTYRLKEISLILWIIKREYHLKSLASGLGLKSQNFKSLMVKPITFYVNTYAL